MTRLVAKTLREAPADAEAISHRLLVRAGYIRRISSGVYSYLPLGFKVLRKIEDIIREEFNAAGAQELLLPALQPIELWEETGRSRTMDDVLMRLDVRGAEFVLGPTHEEAVIATVAQDIASYRDLPATVYQIQTKFRAEARPRYGLLRTREFIMADAYSFDVDQEGMRASYSSVFDAYCRAFDRLGIAYYPVEADAGSIGGDVNHEFMVPAAIGEDHFALCAHCGYKANIEAARRGAREVDGSVEVPKMTEIATPGATTIESAVGMIGNAGHPMSSADMLKSFVAVDDQKGLAVFLVPGDRQVRLPRGYTPMDADGFTDHPFLHRGYVAPMGMQTRGVRVFADHSIRAPRGWTTGANRPDTHVIDALVGRDFVVDEFMDLVVVEDGDACPQCGEPLSLVRSVEAGHTFQLGLTYPEKISSARFTAEDGGDAMYFMGCYGIGVSRLPAVVAEVTSDERGLSWPISVAPFQVHLVAISHLRDAEVARVAEELYSALGAAGLEVLFDDRDLAPGVKLNDADLMGVPLQLVIGPKGIASGMVEIKRRKDGSRREVTVSQAVSAVISLVAELFSEL